MFVYSEWLKSCLAEESIRAHNLKTNYPEMSAVVGIILSKDFIFYAKKSINVIWT